MSKNEYERIREKVSREYKDRLEDKNNQIRILQKMINDLEKENKELRIENLQLKRKCGEEPNPHMIQLHNYLQSVTGYMLEGISNEK